MRNIRNRIILWRANRRVNKIMKNSYERALRDFMDKPV
jgi:hypothetical protein